MTTVVNKHHHTPTANDVYIGRPSLFGNPFVVGVDGTREEVIEAYRHWLWNLLKSEPKAREALLALDGKYLVCWCKPKACHGDVLVDALNWYKEVLSQ